MPSRTRFWLLGFWGCGRAACIDKNGSKQVSKSKVVGQITITITGTSAFETRGALIDRRHGEVTIKPVTMGPVGTLNEAAQQAVEIAAGMIVAIGEIEAMEAEPMFRKVR